MGEIIFHVLMLLIFGVFFNETFDINTKRATDVIGPAGFPQAVIVLGIILTLISLFVVIKKYKEREKNEKMSLKELNVVFIGILAGMVMYTLVVNTIGYFITSLIFLAVVLYLLGERKKVMLILFPLIVAIIFTLLFGRVLSVPLPRGIEPLKSLSYFFY